MLDSFNELPDWISRGLDDLFPYKKSEDFQAKMTVEQLKTQLGQFGITPDQMFDQMNKTLVRMKSELDK